MITQLTYNNQWSNLLTLAWRKSVVRKKKFLSSWQTDQLSDNLYAKPITFWDIVLILTSRNSDKEQIEKKMCIAVYIDDWSPDWRYHINTFFEACLPSSLCDFALKHYSWLAMSGQCPHSQLLSRAMLNLHTNSLMQPGQCLWIDMTKKFKRWRLTPYYLGR